MLTLYLQYIYTFFADCGRASPRHAQHGSSADAHGLGLPPLARPRHAPFALPPFYLDNSEPNFRHAKWGERERSRTSPVARTARLF